MVDAIYPLRYYEAKTPIDSSQIWAVSSKKALQFIWHSVDQPTPARFRLIPEVHKQPLVGRPIVSSKLYQTTPASRYVDSVLSQYLPTIPSYIKDTTHLIKSLQVVCIQPHSLLVTADIVSLYTNLPIKNCIIAIDLFSCAHCRELTPLITELSRYILTNNYFVADGRIYHQINGLAMGTPMAVVAANIYMAQLGE